MFGFTYTHSIPKRDIDAFAKKVGGVFKIRGLKIRSILKE